MTKQAHKISLENVLWRKFMGLSGAKSKTSKNFVISFHISKSFWDWSQQEKSLFKERRETLSIKLTVTVEKIQFITL